jgi:hypothetical protein
MELVLVIGFFTGLAISLAMGDISKSRRGKAQVRGQLARVDVEVDRRFNR